MFVLEIGTEELPPHDVVEATEQVKPNFLLHLYETKLSPYVFIKRKFKRSIGSTWLSILTKTS